MATGSSAVNEVTNIQHGLDILVEGPGPECQRLGHLSQASQSIDTRPALARALSFHVPDNPSHLCHRAHATRKEGDDPGTERRP
jgi:hypothetical protein